jgi:hypothetical protein
VLRAWKKVEGGSESLHLITLQSWMLATTLLNLNTHPRRHQHCMHHASKDQTVPTPD